MRAAARWPNVKIAKQMPGFTQLMHARAWRQQNAEWNAINGRGSFTPDPHVRENALNEAGYTPYSTRSQLERARYRLADGEAPNFIGYAHGRDGRDGRKPRRRIKGYTADQYAKQMDWREQTEREEMARFRASRRPRSAAPRPTAEERTAQDRAAVQRARDKQRTAHDDQVIQNVNKVSGGDARHLPRDMQDGTGGAFALAFRRGRIVGHARRRNEKG